eukprot:4213300-Prymnesium_polylepis.2
MPARDRLRDVPGFVRASARVARVAYACSAGLLLRAQRVKAETMFAAPCVCAVRRSLRRPNVTCALLRER